MVGREANSKETDWNACRRSVGGSGLLKTGQHGVLGGALAAQGTPHRDHSTGSKIWQQGPGSDSALGVFSPPC